MTQIMNIESLKVVIIRLINYDVCDQKSNLLCDQNRLMFYDAVTSQVQFIVFNSMKLLNCTTKNYTIQFTRLNNLHKHNKQK